MIGLAAMIVANLAAFFGARAIARRAATGKPHLDVALLLLVRLALISAAVLAAGTAGLLRPWALGALGVIALGGLLACRACDVSPPKVPDIGRLLAVLIAIVAVRLLLQVWFIAPHNFDAISYHLTKVAEWVRAGGFTREMGVDTHAPFPAGFELLETWWVVFLHHDVLIEMAGVEMLVLAAAACYALARELEMTERASAWAAFIYAMTPGLHLSATSCLNDVAVAAMVIVAMAFVLARAPWSWIALAIGVGLGTKPTFGYALPGVMVLYYIVRKTPKLAPSARGVSAAFAALGLAVGAFWYARNQLWFGSPIYPVGTRGLVASTGELKIQFGPNPANAVRNVLEVLQSRVYDDFTAYGPLLIHISGWGALAFSCGLLGLVLALRTEPPFRKVALAFAISLVSVLVLVNHDPWFMRFVLFFPALLSIAAVKAVERCRPMVAIAGSALAFQFLATFVPADLQAKEIVGLARMSWRERSAGVFYKASPPADSVAFFIVEPVHNRGESYLLYGPDYSRRVVYVRGTSAVEIRAELEREKPGLFYRSRDTSSSALPLEECVRQGFLRPTTGRFYDIHIR